jgi:hypothetical protein
MPDSLYLSQTSRPNLLEAAAKPRRAQEALERVQHRGGPADDAGDFCLRHACRSGGNSVKGPAE